jgi:predicted nucleotidyltransferase component of viral defense system
MIPENFVLQWQENALWQSLSMVEHDLVISRALIDLYQNKVIRDALVFRGGTALNKLYINPPARYSEDIDLVQLTSAPIGPVIDAIRDALNSWLGEPKRIQTERSVKLIYRYKTFEQEPTKLKIEINTTEHFQVNKLRAFIFEAISDWYKGSAEIITYDLEELMATKLKALYQRRKGRDLFDWWYVLSKHLINVSSVIPIFDAYCRHEGEEITQALFEKNLTLKRDHKDFRLDMRPLLPPNIEWDFDNAFNLVLTDVISHIPGSPWKDPRNKI